MKNVMDTLRERGFIKQTVYEEELYKLLGSESVPFYIGFDPTADSLHVGHFMQLIAMKHMQDAGHKPIVLIGGGTGMIGDPSGRTDMRQMMTRETIDYHCECFRRQMARFIKFDGENGAVMVNNADWLLNLNYIEFLRDIGVHFSVNKKYGCKLELGGDDQWSNILAGADLIRRKEQQPAFAMTFTLLTTSDGRKMGKTAKGAVWLDENKTSPYEFYQYWRNIDDADVEKCLKLLTFLPLEEIADLCAHKDERINAAKEKLAFELTKMVHGEEKAADAQAKAKAAFGGDAENMPVAEIPADTATVADVLVAAKAAKSKSEARRLIEGGGVKIDEEKIDDVNAEIPASAKEKGEFVLHKGKKTHIKILFTK